MNANFLRQDAIMVMRAALRGEARQKRVMNVWTIDANYRISKNAGLNSQVEASRLQARCSTKGWGGFSEPKRTSLG